MKGENPRRNIAAIPVFNEKNTSTIAQALLGKVDCVLVVDDGSLVPPNIQYPVRVIRHEYNRGYGDAIHTAMHYALSRQFDALILVDGDGQHDISFVPKLLTLLENCDVAVGNRLHQNSKRVGLPQPVERREANDLMCAVFKRVHTISQINDFFSGFLAFRLKTLPGHMDLRGSLYASPARMWPCLAGAGLRIAEVAVPCIYHSSENNFSNQYESIEALVCHIVKVFTESTVRYLGKSRNNVLDAFIDELKTGSYESVREWFETASMKFLK